MDRAACQSSCFVGACLVQCTALSALCLRHLVACSWVEDFTGHTVTAFTFEGTPLVQIGQKGVAGNGTDPLQFGNVADAAIQTAATSAEPTIVYATDGDGGYDNRVVKIAVEFSATETPKYSVDWATPHSFNSPHSIALHARTNMLVVADRGNNATKLLDAATGKDLGVWDCGLDFGEKGVPFGVRTLSLNGHDLVLVASMDNPQDHRNQFIHVLDASKLSAATGSASACSVNTRAHILLPTRALHFSHKTSLT